MRKQIALYVLLLFLAVAEMAKAEPEPETTPSTDDEKVIAVLEILELMDMMDDMALLKDMEYLMEEDPNEPQK